MRQIFNFLIIALIIFPSLLFAGCTPKEPEVIPTYSITIAETVNGTVLLDPQKDSYEKDELVTISFIGNNNEEGSYICKEAYIETTVEVDTDTGTEIVTEVVNSWTFVEERTISITANTTVYSTFGEVIDATAHYYLKVDVDDETTNSFNFDGSVYVSVNNVQKFSLTGPAGKNSTLDFASEDLQSFNNFVNYFKLIDGENAIAVTVTIDSILSIDYIETGITAHDIYDVSGINIEFDGAGVYSALVYFGVGFDIYLYVEISTS
jgi:hypothetical protein